MRAGRLRHRLTIQQQTETRDSYGAAIITWSDVATVWGAIEPLSGQELFAQQQVQPETKVRIVLRYRAIDPSYRIVHDGKYYNITEVIDHGLRGQMLTLMCREGVSDDSTLDDSNYVTFSGVYVVNGGTQVVHTT